MEKMTEIIDAVTSKLAEVTDSNVVVGDPIEMGQVTIVPLSRISVGMGGGGGEGQGDFQGEPTRNKKHAPGKGMGMAGAAGGGAKVRPVAVVVFTEEGVEVMPVTDKKSVLDKIFDKVPEVIDLVKKLQDKK